MPRTQRASLSRRTKLRTRNSQLNVIEPASHLFKVNEHVVAVAAARRLRVLQRLQQRLVLRPLHVEGRAREEGRGGEVADQVARGGHAKEGRRRAEHRDGADAEVRDGLRARTLCCEGSYS